MVVRSVLPSCFKRHTFLAILVCSRARFFERHSARCGPQLLPIPRSGRRVAACRFFDQVDARYRIPAYRAHTVECYLCVSVVHDFDGIVLAKSSMLFLPQTRLYVHKWKFVYHRVRPSTYQPVPFFSLENHVSNGVLLYFHQISAQVRKGRAVGGSSGPAE